MEAVGIICTIWGILNIILFFKIWGMCNNVSRILDVLESKQLDNDNNALSQKSTKRETQQKKSSTDISTPKRLNPWV